MAARMDTVRLLRLSCAGDRYTGQGWSMGTIWAGERGGELTRDTRPPLSSSPAPPPLPGPVLAAEEGDSLGEAVGGGKEPAGVNEDGSTDVRALGLQAGLPWPLAGLHGPAAVDPPRHLGLPARRGGSPATCNRDTGGAPKSQPGRPPLHRWESQARRPAA